MSPAHSLPLRVYYEDTDFSGVVYHASYLRFMERGRTEFLRSAGLMQRDLHAGPGGFYFVVRRMTIDWLRPAVMDDEIVVETSVSDVRGASMVMHQSVTRGGEMLVIGEVMVVGVRDGKPSRLPAEVRSALMAAIPAGQDQTGQDQNGSGPLPE